MVPTARNAAVIYDSHRIARWRRIPGIALLSFCSLFAGLAFWRGTLVAAFGVSIQPVVPHASLWLVAGSVFLAMAVLVALGGRRRIFWNEEKQKLVIERRGLFAIDVQRMFLAEVALVRIRRGRIKSLEYWDLEFSDFAGRRTWLTRTYSRGTAVGVASQIAEAIGRPVKGT